ncbi:hypothetical protein H7X87_04560 [Acetobacteraceae bacterium]|nr:hypothetical protein [Candidatus Parcubacteria bacterium]
MNLAERLLVSRSEKHLQKYRDAAKHVHTEFLRQYYAYLPEIESYYDQAGYWHGTGRYHYYHGDDSRYEGVNTKHVVNVLESILDHRALTGHQDLWITGDGKFEKTVSVAPIRMHARLFAHIHLREGVWLPYVFGGTRFWMGIIIALASKELIFTLRGDGRTFLKNALLNRTSLKNFRTWASAIRNLDDFKVLPLWRAYDLRSDIVGNYAILFGIKRSAIQGDGVLPFIKGLEVRVAKSIRLGDMTHIEVPLENVEETKRILSAKNISLPIIPLEFGELYCAQFPFKKLVYV